MNAFLCLPVAWKPSSKEDNVPAVSKQQPQQPERAPYLLFLLGLIAAYLGAIFHMDKLACEGTMECYNYSKLEWSFDREEVLKALMMWTPKGRAAMALSTGLHILSSFLFAQLFIFGGVLAASHYSTLGWSRMERIASALPPVGRIFNILYCAAHSTIAGMVVSGAPNASSPIAAGILIICALIILILCALFLIISLVLVLYQKSGTCCKTVPMGADGAKPGAENA